MMFCSKCGAMIDENAQFCPVCAAPVEAPAQEENPEFTSPEVVVPPVEAFANPVEETYSNPEPSYTAPEQPYTQYEQPQYTPPQGYTAPNANPYSQQTQYQGGNPYSQQAQQPYGQPQYQQQYNQQGYQPPYGQPNYGNQANPFVQGTQKSKLAAGLLAIFLGTLGIHNFYLGYNKKGVIQLLITLLGSWIFGIGAIIAFVWSIVDAVHIFQGSYPDANGVPLTD